MKNPLRNRTGPAPDEPIRLDYDEILDHQFVQQQAALLMQQFLVRSLHRHGKATPRNFGANWIVQGGFLVRQDMIQPPPAPAPQPNKEKEKT